MTKEKKWEEVVTKSEEGDFNETWKPEEGDEIEGAYKSKKTGVGKFKSTIYVLETKKGDIDIWASKAISDALEDKEFGISVKIVYHGEKPSPKGTFYDYKVYTDLNEAGTASEGNSEAPESTEPLMEGGEEIPF